MASEPGSASRKGKDQYVLPHPDGGWQVVGEGNKKATVRTKTEEDAVRVAKQTAWNQGSEYIPYGGKRPEAKKPPEKKPEVKKEAKKGFFRRK